MSSLETTLVDRIHEDHSGWPGPFTSDDVFGTHDPRAMAAEVESFCRAHLGSSVRRCLFYAASVGCAFGLELDNGRRIVLKAHQVTVPLDYLVAAGRIQGALAARGFPCPAPLLAPTAHGGCLVTVEQFVDEGVSRDAHDPDVRRAMAQTLAELVSLAQDLADLPGLRPGLLSRQEESSLWPRPHNRLFDFEATRRGTEWIDAVATRARALLGERRGKLVVGHVDWSVKHFRFVDGRVRVVYDWDSLALDEEAVLVGQAARGFTMTWDLPVRLTPTPDEARAFVAEYEHARGRVFSSEERARLGAAAAYALAYTARCEACGDPHSRDFPPGSAREALARHAEDFLRL